MNMITGIDRATGGRSRSPAPDLAGLSEGKVAEWRGRTVGVIFQFFQLLPTLTVVENVMLPMDFGGLWTPRERQAAGDGPARAGRDGRPGPQAAGEHVRWPAAARRHRPSAGQ